MLHTTSQSSSWSWQRQGPPSAIQEPQPLSHRGSCWNADQGHPRPEVGAYTRSRVSSGFQRLLMSEATALQGFQTVLRKPENLLWCRRDLCLVSGQSSQVHVIQSPWPVLAGTPPWWRVLRWRRDVAGQGGGGHSVPWGSLGHLSRTCPCPRDQRKLFALIFSVYLDILSISLDIQIL